MKKLNPLFAVLIMGLIFISCTSKEEKEKLEREKAVQDSIAAVQDSIETAKAKIEAERLEAERLAEFKWKYDTNVDAMGNKNNTASLSSKNEIYLPSPYDGAQNGTLVVRNHTDYGKHVFFYVDRGQIVGDKVSIRFDEEKSYSLGYNEPVDGSSEFIFMKGYSKLIQKLKKAKKLALQVTFYDAGSKIFEFDVSDLDMSQLK